MQQSFFSKCKKNLNQLYSLVNLEQEKLNVVSNLCNILVKTYLSVSMQLPKLLKHLEMPKHKKIQILHVSAI